MVAFITGVPLVFAQRKRTMSQRFVVSTLDEPARFEPRAKREKPLTITSVGNLCLDIILPISSFPVRRGDHQRLTSGARLELGGSLNLLISASRFGANVAPIAYVAEPSPTTHASDHAISSFVLESVKRLGIDATGLVPRQGVVIPTCAAVSDRHGAHTFLASNELPENNDGHNEEDAPDVMLNTVASSKVLIVDGYALHSDRSLVRQTVRAALDSGTEVWVDPQAATNSLLRTQDDLFRFLLEHCRGISLTAEEAFLITNTRDPMRTIRQIATEHCPSATTFLLKDGTNGSHVAWKEGGQFDICSVPAFSTDFMDSVGAGDAFLGAYLAGRLAQDLSFRDSGLLASAMGAATCMHRGAGESGVGSQANVMKLLEGTSLGTRLGAVLATAVV